MKIEISGLEDMKEGARSELVREIERTLDEASLDEYSISINFVDKKAMRALNSRFKKKNAVTDVLSFPTPDMEKTFPHTKHILGDIVICHEVALEQAHACGHSLKEEIIVLCVHGLFHLLGYDHEISDEEADIQMQGEIYLLEKAGFSPAINLIGRI